MKRNIFILILACVAFSGSLVAALATTDQRNFNLRGYVDATQTKDLPFRIPRLGVNAELTQYTTSELDYHFDLMQQAGITWVRQFVYAHDQFDWAEWDTIVQTIQNYPQLQLVIVLSSLSPPVDVADFSDFAYEFAGRYRHNIHYYQIWDEPNIYTGWGNQNPRPADYAALLSQTYDAIHSIDENALVIAAALAPTTESGPKNINDLDYLNELYAYGLHKFSDALAAKPYGFDYSPLERTVNKDLLNFSRIIALREIMEAHGDNAKSLWASHWGWNSLSDNWDGQPSIWGQVTLSEQSSYTLEALYRAEREWPWLGGMILHHWQPDVPLDNPQWGFSILQQNGTPGTLWNTLKDHHKLKNEASNGLFAPRNIYARYSGTWSFSDIGADIGWTQDSKLEFQFTGNDIALLVREGDYVAYFYPHIDGKEANATPQDVSGNSYVLLRSGDLTSQTRLIPIGKDLGDTSHILSITTDELVPDEAISRWPLVGYAVSSGNLTKTYNRQIVISWVTTLISGIAVILSATSIQWNNTPIKIIWKQINYWTQLIIGLLASLALLAGMFLTWQDGIPTIFRREPVQIGLSLITAGIIYINEFGIILTVFAIMILFFIIYDRLILGLMLTLLWAPFFLSPVELYKFAFPVAEIIILITFGAWLLKLFIEWGQKPQQPTITISKDTITVLDLFVIGWLLSGFVSLLWVEHTGPALTELRTMFLQPIMFYVILRTIPHDKSTIHGLINALLLSGTAIALIGFLMWFQGNVIEAEGGVQRLTSVYGSPNNVALIIGRCLPFVIAFILLPVERRLRWFALFALLSMSIALILTKSAGGLFVGVPISIFTIFILVFKQRAAKPVITFFIIVVVGLLIAFQSPRFSRIIDFSQGTTFYRIRIWQSTINIIKDEPLTGIGLDQFLYTYRDEYIMPDAWEEPNLSHPHNIVFDIWTRLGVMGLIIFVGIQTLFWRRCIALYTHFQKTQEVWKLAILIGTVGSMVNLLSHGLIDNSLFVIDLAYVFMFIIAIPEIFTLTRREVMIK